MGQSASLPRPWFPPCAQLGRVFARTETTRCTAGSTRFVCHFKSHTETWSISRMRDTYAKAHLTIVLDSELQTTEAKPYSDEELAVRVGLTSWMRRAWTFQEGALSGDMLRFLFANGPGPLTLWKGETFSGPTTNAFPCMTDSLGRMNAKVADWAARCGGSPYV